MSWYVIEPRDPLMVRDGRPFGSEGADAHSLDFPPPSVIAGALRTRVWHAKGGWEVEAAKQLAVRGPILAERSGEAWTPLFATPRDCVFFDAAEGDTKKRLRRFALSPQGGNWGQSSLPAGWLERGFRPVGAALPDAKAAKSPPAFWTLEAIKAWLSAPAVEDLFEKENGRPALQHERRVHVAINPDTDTGADGKLFQTDGLRFEEFDHDAANRAAEKAAEKGADKAADKEPRARQLGLLVSCAHEALKEGILTLGGERRVSLFSAVDEPTWVRDWAAPKLSGGRGARVLLLTPAIFQQGGVPETIAGAPVVAAAVGRPQTISGWDMVQGGPKPVRRMAPAGSVYWVDLAERDATAWAEEVHMRAISDDAQDRRDGFGLAAVGVWR